MQLLAGSYKFRFNKHNSPSWSSFLKLLSPSHWLDIPIPYAKGKGRLSFSDLAIFIRGQTHPIPIMGEWEGQDPRISVDNLRVTVFHHTHNIHIVHINSPLKESPITYWMMCCKERRNHSITHLTSSITFMNPIPLAYKVRNQLENTSIAFTAMSYSIATINVLLFRHCYGCKFLSIRPPHHRRDKFTIPFSTLVPSVSPRRKEEVVILSWLSTDQGDTNQIRLSAS